MTMETYDASNLRALDKSGNGLHFQFGNGATSTTYPTKLTSRGYSFDGTTDYLKALNNQTNAITEGTWAIFARVSNYDAIRVWTEHRDATNYRYRILHTTTDLRFYSGDGTNYATLGLPPIGMATTVIGTVTSSGRRLYCNGVISAYNNTGTPIPSTLVTATPVIGSDYALSSYLPGRIYWFGHWEYALSELQMKDLEMRLRRQLNDV